MSVKMYARLILNVMRLNRRPVLTFIFGLPNTFLEGLKKLLWQASSIEYPESHVGIYERMVPVKQQVIQKEVRLLSVLQNYVRALAVLFSTYDVAGLTRSYGRLNNEDSRQIFLDVVAYQLFSTVRIRFPVFSSPLWDRYQELDNLVIAPDTMKIGNWDFNLYNLVPIGMDITLYNNPLGIFIDFVLEQYKYKNLIQVEAGDYVIDGGACSGDTALYFAHKAGQHGRVYSFEFLEENLNVFDKNISLNPPLANIIDIIPRPLSYDSKQYLYAVGSGPSATLTDIKPSQEAKEYQSISIDEFVEQNNIQKIDFIKLDIEGSELATLQGALKTIRRFKPKLAICIYHKKQDLWEIPDIIKEAVPEYDLYVDQFTTIGWETVLFAKAPS